MGDFGRQEIVVPAAPDDDTALMVEASLTAKQKDFVRYYADEGLSALASARAAGYTAPNVMAYRLLRHDKVVAVIRAKQKDVRRKHNLSRDDVIEGMLDAVRSSATAGEMVAAWREIGRLVGAYEPEKVEVEHKLSEAQLKRLEAVPTEQLLKMADIDGLEVVEGEYEVVDDEDPEADD